LELNILSILNVWTLLCSEPREFERINVTQMQNICPVSGVLSLSEQLNKFCIILIYIQQDATLHGLFYLETALHVSGGATTHHHGSKQL
jgi:hypothetical protein